MLELLLDELELGTVAVIVAGHAYHEQPPDDEELLLDDEHDAAP